MMGFRDGKASDTLAKSIRKDFPGYEVINMSIA
ncbi:lipase, partial [Lactobacillus halodurans]|nr:lipase [Companilactobacillus halodurans]